MYTTDDVQVIYSASDLTIFRACPTLTQPDPSLPVEVEKTHHSEPLLDAISKLDLGPGWACIICMKLAIAVQLAQT